MGAHAKKNVSKTNRGERIEKWCNQNWVDCHHNKSNDEHKCPKVNG